MNNSDHWEQQLKMQPSYSNSINSPQAALSRSNSTSTMIFEEVSQPCRSHWGRLVPPTTLLQNLSPSLRSLLKTSGLFNKDMESSDKLNELLSNDNEFELHRLWSGRGDDDLGSIDMEELAQFDFKLPDNRSISEFLQCESFDQLMGTNPINDSAENINETILPSTENCPTVFFSELRPVPTELMANEMFRAPCPNPLKTEPNYSAMYTELNASNSFGSSSTAPLAAISSPLLEQINFDPSALAAFQHDHAFLSKRTSAISTPSPSPTVSKPTRITRRTTVRVESIASSIGSSSVINDDSCSSSSMMMTSTSVRGKGPASSLSTKRLRNVNRAKDIRTSDDLSYYLERRRKNNEASKMSRAARKQKFGDMDKRCKEYERVNDKLRQKIAILETVTTTLRSGLVHSFQAKTGAKPRF